MILAGHATLTLVKSYASTTPRISAVSGIVLVVVMFLATSLSQRARSSVVRVPFCRHFRRSVLGPFWGHERVLARRGEFALRDVVTLLPEFLYRVAHGKVFT